MDDPTRSLIEQVHARGSIGLVLVVTGGGARAVSWLHSVPGASATMLETLIPYASAASDEYVGEDLAGAGYVSSERSLRMARRAFARAVHLCPEGSQPVGIVSVSAMSTTRTRRGANHAYVAISTPSPAKYGYARTSHLELHGETRDEQEEELSQYIIGRVAEASFSLMGAS